MDSIKNILNTISNYLPSLPKPADIGVTLCSVAIPALTAPRSDSEDTDSGFFTVLPLVAAPVLAVGVYVAINRCKQNEIAPINMPPTRPQLIQAVNAALVFNPNGVKYTIGGGYAVALSNFTTVKTTYSDTAGDLRAELAERYDVETDRIGISYMGAPLADSINLSGYWVDGYPLNIRVTEKRIKSARSTAPVNIPPAIPQQLPAELNQNVVPARPLPQNAGTTAVSIREQVIKAGVLYRTFTHNSVAQTNYGQKIIDLREEFARVNNVDPETVKVFYAGTEITNSDTAICDLTQNGDGQVLITSEAPSKPKKSDRSTAPSNTQETPPQQLAGEPSQDVADIKPDALYRKHVMQGPVLYMTFNSRGFAQTTYGQKVMDLRAEFAAARNISIDTVKVSYGGKDITDSDKTLYDLTENGSGQVLVRESLN